MLKQNYHSQIQAIETAALSNKFTIIVFFFVGGGEVVLFVRLNIINLNIVSREEQTIAISRYNYGAKAIYSFLAGW